MIHLLHMFHTCSCHVQGTAKMKLAARQGTTGDYGEIRWEKIEKVLSLLFDCLDMSRLNKWKKWIFVNVSMERRGKSWKINLFVRDFLQRGVRRGAELSCAKAEKMLLTSWNLDTRASWKHLRSSDWIRLPCIACRFPFQYVPVHLSVLQVFKLWFGMIWPCALCFSPVLWKGTYGILWPESVLHLTDSAELGIGLQK